MIISRKLCTIYDVDVIGIAALILIALAAAFAVFVPARASAGQRRALATKIAAANTTAEQVNSRLRTVNAEIGLLQSGVAVRAETAPKPGALTPFLQRVAQLAEQYDLQITQVLPQPTQAAAGYLFTDVELSAHGSTRGFLRLLDQLARENPYCSLQHFSIKHLQTPGEQRCQLSWTLRLHMLAPAPHTLAGVLP